MRLVPSVVLALALSGLAAGMPDLALDTPTLGQALLIELKYFPVDSCELRPADLCVRAAGARKLLRFDVFAVNQGDTDLVLGVPDPNALLPNGEPMWVFSDCPSHNHFHFQTFARYELRRRGEPTAVLGGQKRSFCVEDTKRATATTPRLYCCNESCGDVQGVQVGWGDLYPSNLACQWIDITDDPSDLSGRLDLPPGAYDLCVLLNTARLLPDGDPTNDVGCVPVTLSAPGADLPPPRVRLRAPRRQKRGRVGRPLKIAWKKRVRGKLRFQEVWFSRDGGLTYQLIAGGGLLPAARRSYRWVVPTDAVTETARVKVVVWEQNPPDDPGAGALRRVMAESEPFRVLP